MKNTKNIKNKKKKYIIVGSLGASAILAFAIPGVVFLVKDLNQEKPDLNAAVKKYLSKLKNGAALPGTITTEQVLKAIHSIEGYEDSTIDGILLEPNPNDGSLQITIGKHKPFLLEPGSFQTRAKDAVQKLTEHDFISLKNKTVLPTTIEKKQILDIINAKITGLKVMKKDLTLMPNIIDG